MKLRKEFALREVAENYIIVPLEENAVCFNSMITLNETGAFLWRLLEQGKNENELLLELLNEYDIDESSAKKDIEKYLGKMKDAGILEV